jgi:hypothetical protein
VVEASGIPVAYHSSGKKKAVFNGKKIWFNGLYEDGHETFIVEQIYKPEDWETPCPREGNKWFNFCKTAYKPYDLCVTACLIILKHYLKDNFLVYSDGDDPDWEKARKLVQKTLTYREKYHYIRKEEKGGLLEI